MAFLTLNGWTIPVRDGQARGSRTPFGDSGPSWTNRPNRQRRGLPRSWSLTTKPIGGPDAETLEALASGRGYHFPFDGHLSSTNGLPPQGGVGTVSFPGWIASPPVVGRSYLVISSGTVVWNPGVYDGKWTVMFWRDVSGTPEHVVVRGDGAKWLDGVRNDAAVTTELTVSNGAVQLAVGEYDDLVILPFNASTSYVEAVTDWMITNTVAYPDCPALLLSGDIVGGDEVLVHGREVGDTYVQHGSPTGWVNNARNVSFTVEEQQPYEPKLVALDEAYILSGAYASGFDIRPVLGADYRKSTPGAGVTLGAAAGPFGLGGASTFSGTSSNIPLLVEQAERMVGRDALSMVAWVRKADNGFTRAVLSFACVSTAEAKAQLYFGGSNTVVVSGRSETGETTRTVLGVTAVTDGEWHCVGGVLDPGRGKGAVYLDGELENEDDIAWNAPVFDETVFSSGHFIGSSSSGIWMWSGAMAMVGWAYRRLGPEDFRAIYERGLKGWFR